MAPNTTAVRQEKKSAPLDKGQTRIVHVPSEVNGGHWKVELMRKLKELNSRKQVLEIHLKNGYLRAKYSVISPCTIVTAHAINTFLKAKHYVQTQRQLQVESRRRAEEAEELERLDGSGQVIHGGKALGLFAYLKETTYSVCEYRHAIALFVGNNLKQRYRGSLIGFAWGLLAPLTTMVVLAVVFSAIFHADFKKTGLYIFSGLLPWTFFQESILKGSHCFVGADSYLRKLKIPKIFFPIVSVSGDTINLVFSFLALFALGLGIGFKLNATLVLFPLIAAIFAIFTLGIVLLTAVATVYMRDLPHILQVMLSTGFYLLPILYEMDRLPASYQHLLMLNPLYGFINLFRAVVCFGKFPTTYEWLQPTALAFLTLTLGLLVLRKKEDDLIYRL
jgi:ABC-type polysaccharide/polyol phosphate export permease